MLLPRLRMSAGWLLMMAVAYAAPISHATSVGAPVRHTIPTHGSITTTVLLESTVASTQTIYLPLIFNDYPSCNDQEDNDIPAQAKIFTTPLGTYCRGSFEDDIQGEDDYYLITLAENQTITITLNGFSAGADYDLLLYDAAITEVAVSNRTGSEPEQLTYLATKSGIYYIRINMYKKVSPATNTYTMQVTVS